MVAILHSIVLLSDIFCLVFPFCMWGSWLRHCATSRKVAGLIPDGVIGIFHWHNPSGRTMALWSTQPLTEMSTRYITWGGKGGRCVGLTTLPPSCPDCLEIWELQLPGTLMACQACNGIALRVPVFGVCIYCFTCTGYASLLSSSLVLLTY